MPELNLNIQAKYSGALRVHMTLLFFNHNNRVHIPLFSGNFNPNNTEILESSCQNNWQAYE